jgi:ubiquinone/menaquinone biosynthesis C-methylase UbiE
MVASVSIPWSGYVRLSFDAIASQFDSQRGLPRTALQAWMELVDDLAGGHQGHIVEPGIGTGRIALPLAMAGHHITGADISRPMLDACAESARNLQIADHVTLLNADATDMPLPDHTFDLGVIVQVLYLVPDWPAVLDELARLVKPGGFVIHLTEPTLEGVALARWSSSWRQVIEETGFRHIALSPTDAEVQAEFLRRWPDVEVRELASWSFGQSVNEAREDYAARLRPLYASIPDDEWRAATDRFLAWTMTAFPHGDERLEGTVTLTAMIASV